MHLATIPRLPLARFVPDAAPEALIDAPCFGYLLTSPGLTVVVDTGPAIEGNSSVVSVTGGEPPEVMRRALLRRERRESDVRFVVHTHLHYDHMQNDDPFVNAQVVVQAMERDFALERDSFEFYRGIAGFIEQLGDRLYSVSGDTELAAGVRLVRSGGHTPGHQVVAVETTFGTVCIAGDVVPLAENAHVVGPSTPDAETTTRFLERISAERWLVLPGHDPSFQRTYDLGQRRGSLVEPERDHERSPGQGHIA